MIAVLLALAVFIVIGALDFFKTKSYDDFLVAGRKQKVSLVTLSLLATIIGGSATVGLINKSAVIGTPWFWWLGVGVIGLLLQAFLLTEKVRALEAYTLPDVAYKTMGRPASVLTSLIIVFSWVAIVAAQFLAAAKTLHGMLPSVSIQTLLILISIVIVLYAFLGGQKSVMKTDALQFGLIVLGLIIALIVLYFFNAKPVLQPVRWEFFNEKFGLGKWFALLILTGGAYFIGPDMFSRVLTAKDGKTAKKAVYLASFVLIFLAVFIVLLGAWVQSRFPVGERANAVKTLLGALPPVAGWLLSIGFISAMISSADTILLTSASIIENDLIGAFEPQKKKSDNVRLVLTRILVVLIGGISLLIALFNTSIIGLLLKAYSIYTPGIVPPLAMAVIFYKTHQVNRLFLLISLITGGTLGLLGTLLGIAALPLVGFGVALLIAFVGVWISPAK